MSFKRDGDDKYALENLRKRRVSDLLFEDIQNGEVSKLRNGRYLCKVCPHCPTFDTLNMFQVHKQGKKHQNIVEYQEMQNLELQELIQKREHEQATSGHGGQIQQVLGPGAAPGYSKPKPYDPRSKRHKARPFERKTVVDIRESSETSPQYHASATNLNSLPSSSEEPVRSARSCQQEGAFKMPANKKTCIEAASSGNGPGSLSQSQANMASPHSRNTSNTTKQYYTESEKDDITVKPNSVSKLVGSGKSESCTQHYFARKRKVHIVKDPVEHSVNFVQKQDFSKSWEYFKDKPPSRVVSSRGSKEMQKNQSVKTQVGGNNDSGPQINTCIFEPKTECHISTPERKEKAEKMLKAFGSGWKKDWTGKWVKDEDAEFDSDEEPPDIT